MRRYKRATLWTLAAVCWLLLVVVAARASDTGGTIDPFAAPEKLDELGEEIQFFKVESDVVTSVSRHPESLWGAAAAIHVITGEEISLSGAESLTDALRMVPGLDVAAVDRNMVAVSARGMAFIFADKMLVLLDGRPIYTPVFGGTIWHEWNTFMPDIDRIEVIRGPGGALWGSNAMNGVINIITKSAEDTQGGLARALGGGRNLTQGELRYGGRFGDFKYRIFGLSADDDGFESRRGGRIDDGREEQRTGFRFDWDLGRGLSLSGTGEYYDSRLGSAISLIDLGPSGLAPTRIEANDRIDTELFTGMMRLEKDFADGSHAQIQFAIDDKDASYPFLSTIIGPSVPPVLGLSDERFALSRKTWEFDVQHSFRPHRRHRITWGGNFRQTNVSIDATAVLDIDPPRNNLDVLGGFVQDQIDLWDGVRLTLGTKIEDNTFTGTNFQPSARLAHRFNERTTLWGSFSRAINTPAFGDLGLTFANVPTPSGPVNFVADGRVDDTKLLAYEVGLRHRFSDDLSAEIATYYNDYDGISTFSGKTTSLDPTTGATVFLDNAANAYSYGVEAAANLVVNDNIRSEANVTWQRLTQRAKTDRSLPSWKANLRTIAKLTPKITVVPTLHFVDDVENSSVLLTDAMLIKHDAYVRSDLAIHYKHAANWPTISFVGQNLFDKRHTEFQEDIVRPLSEITRWWFFRIEQEF